MLDAETGQHPHQVLGRKVAGRAIPQYFVLVGGGCSDEGTAHFGKVVSKVPVNRLTDGSMPPPTAKAKALAAADRKALADSFKR